MLGNSRPMRFGHSTVERTDVVFSRSALHAVVHRQIGSEHAIYRARDHAFCGDRSSQHVTRGRVEAPGNRLVKRRRRLRLEWIGKMAEEEIVPFPLNRSASQFIRNACPGFDAVCGRIGPVTSTLIFVGAGGLRGYAGYRAGILPGLPLEQIVRSGCESQDRSTASQPANVEPAEAVLFQLAVHRFHGVSPKP